MPATPSVRTYLITLLLPELLITQDLIVGVGEGFSLKAG